VKNIIKILRIGETEILNGVIRDKAQLEQNREKLNRAIKKA